METETQTGRPTFSDLFAASFHEVVGFVAIATGAVHLAEEAAQEGFARAYVRWDEVSRKAHPVLWVKRTAMNWAIDNLRQRRREVGLPPTAVASVRDEVERLWAEWELAQLTPMERAMAILRYQYGHDTFVVGGLLGRSPQTVRTYLQRLRRRGPHSKRQGERV